MNEDNNGGYEIVGEKLEFYKNLFDELNSAQSKFIFELRRDNKGYVIENDKFNFYSASFVDSDSFTEELGWHCSEFLEGVQLFLNRRLEIEEFYSDDEKQEYVDSCENLIDFLFCYPNDKM
ncbi:MAG: hypothetical protein QG564_1833 [Campylobacterota bacterium]|nr:hypothetical protein [Campylobacterota bacterium]